MKRRTRLTDALSSYDRAVFAHGEEHEPVAPPLMFEPLQLPDVDYERMVCIRDRRAHNDWLAEQHARVQRRIRVGAAALVATATGFAGITAASALWSAHGVGSGTSKATTLLQPTSVTAAASANLLPNDATTDLVVHLTNPNPYTVAISAISQNNAVVVGGGSGCTPSNSAVSVPSPHSVSGVTVLPGAQVVTIPNAVKMGITSDNGCQNASFTIPITLTVNTP